MRKGILAVVLVGLAALGAALPAVASDNAGVVAGTSTIVQRGISSYAVEIDLTFAGTVSVDDVPYRGTFDVSGTSDTLPVTTHQPPPNPFPGAFVLAGSTATGNAIAGTCGEPGSTIATSGSPVPITSAVTYNLAIVVVCTASVDGGAPGALTMSMSLMAVGVPTIGATGTINDTRRVAGTFS
jgi:hypothetical protein